MVLVAQVFLAVAVLTPVLLLAAGVGLWLLRKRTSRLLRAAGAFFVLIAIAGAVQLVRASIYWRRVWDGLDLSPSVSEPDIIGPWRTDKSKIIFFPDHTFTLTGKNESRGKWELNVSDYDVYARSPGGMIVGHEQWRVVTKHGQLRLVRNAPLDWDEWNGDLGFRKEYGRDCAEEPCPAGLECMPHINIAQQPTWKTCERACRDNSDCAAGQSCVQTDRGPRSSSGKVCLTSPD